MQDRKTTALKFVWCNIVHWITKFFRGELTKIHCWNTTWMKMLWKSPNNNSLLFKTGEWFLKSLFFTVLYRSCFCHKHRWNPCVTFRISPLHQHYINTTITTSVPLDNPQFFINQNKKSTAVNICKVSIYANNSGFVPVCTYVCRSLYAHLYCVSGPALILCPPCFPRVRCTMQWRWITLSVFLQNHWRASCVCNVLCVC